ncbi:hypothetical protein [Streptomyces sp. NPDC007264]|uniref:hypothetical protein n=1 Tax=Streptomyces sp. NPDC007264 TaxID=3364777 RepID=UPI0036D910B6
MTDRERDPYADDAGYVEDMTEETLGAQEQARQERQHRQEERQQRGRHQQEERQQQRGRPSDHEYSYPEDSDDDLL